MSLIDQVRATRQMPPPEMARAIRIAAGVSQEALANELEVSRLSIIRWEAGTCRPRGERAARYAELMRALQTELAS